MTSAQSYTIAMSLHSHDQNLVLVGPPILQLPTYLLPQPSMPFWPLHYTPADACHLVSSVADQAFLV